MNIDPQQIIALLQQYVIQIPVFLAAIILHEIAHGYMAYQLGDSTAKDAGRLTLNPIKHIDPLGAIAFFIIKIGWAKPVPVNPMNFKDPGRDMIKVALAGPGMNLFLATISALAFRGLVSFPILPGFILEPVAVAFIFSVQINILLAVFNCLPIPPLDGSRVLIYFLPAKAAQSYARFERFSFLLILGLFYTGVLWKIISPIFRFGVRFLLGPGYI